MHLFLLTWFSAPDRLLVIIWCGQNQKYFINTFFENE